MGVPDAGGIGLKAAEEVLDELLGLLLGELADRAAQRLEARGQVGVVADRVGRGDSGEQR